jgi:pimeloyl-ACP methyl ester carboxylesterase
VASLTPFSVRPAVTRVPLADPATLPVRDERSAPWPGRTVTSGGVTLHVRETPGPDGTPAVYVHGLNGSATNWTDRAGRAAAEFEARGLLPWAGEAVERTAKAMLASWVRGESLWTVAARVRVPTLVIWGDRDRLVAPRLAPRTAAVLRGKLLVLPGVGHVAQIEAPDEVARAVAGMWDALADGTWEDPRT